MRPQHRIPDLLEDRIIELSVGWLNRLQYKEQTKENYEAITFTLDEHREPNICHAFIALKGANRAWHRAVQRFMGRWHIIQYAEDPRTSTAVPQCRPRPFARTRDQGKTNEISWQSRNFNKKFQAPNGATSRVIGPHSMTIGAPRRAHPRPLVFFSESDER